MTNLKPATNLFANRAGYSDVEPFEIVKVVSEKTIDIRVMDTSENKTKMDFHVGGFSAHCSNQSEQKYDYASNSENKTIRARLRKDGYFHSAWGRHFIAETPQKFHDYNF
tara:strand:+ start:43 stop:372 length:330 start_codon:yes stop_codon:yes gene_type:complete